VTNLRTPARLTDISSEWLTHALTASGVIRDSAVEDVQIEAVGEGQGSSEDLARLKLSYRDFDAEAPLSLIAKISGNDPVAARNHWNPGVDPPELRFYRELAGRTPLSTPRFYHGEIDVENRTNVILLEDLSPARAGNPVVGCSDEEEELAVMSLSRCHAQYWGDPAFESARWPDSLADVGIRSGRFYRERAERFIDKFGDELSRDVNDLAIRLTDKVVFIHERLARPPITLVHGEFQLQNLFFEESERGLHMTVIDWKEISRGRGPYDLAVFLGCYARNTAKSDIDVVRTYHAALLRNGVSGYPFEECLDDYKFAMLRCLSRVVNLMGLLDLNGEHEKARMRIRLERAIQSVIELGAAELLGGR